MLSETKVAVVQASTQAEFAQGMNEVIQEYRLWRITCLHTAVTAVLGNREGLPSLVIIGTIIFERTNF